MEVSLKEQQRLHTTRTYSDQQVGITKYTTNRFLNNYVSLTIGCSSYHCVPYIFRTFNKQTMIQILQLTPVYTAAGRGEVLLQMRPENMFWNTEENH